VVKASSWTVREEEKTTFSGKNGFFLLSTKIYLVGEVLIFIVLPFFRAWVRRTTTVEKNAVPLFLHSAKEE
jgi:hypothetical protein